MSKLFRYDLTKVIDDINVSSTREAEAMLEKDAHASKAGVTFGSYISFFTGLFSKSDKSTPVYFKGVERMLQTMLTNLKLLKLQKKI